MTEIRTPGIIIRKTNMGEADRLLTVITPSHGKIKVMAKGARKPKAKLAAWLDMFRYNDLNLVSGRTFWIATGAQTMGALVPEGLSWDKLTSAYYICELIDKLIEDGQSVPGVFELTVDSLKNLGEGSLPETLVQAAFEIKLLEIIGMSPQLNRCTVSGDELSADDQISFSLRLGGLLSNAKSASDDFARPVGINAVKIMRLLAVYPVETVAQVKADEEAVREAVDLISAFTAYVLEARPKSLGVMGKLAS